MLGDSLRRRRHEGRPEPARPTRPSRRPTRRRFTWAHWLLAAIVILLVSFGTGYLLSTFVLFPAPETARSGVPVPDLYGMERQEAEGELVEEGLGVGRVETLASADVPAGLVIAQSPVAGQQLRPSATVDLVLSSGPPELSVPPVDGLSEDLARDLLEQAGFVVEATQMPSSEPAGVVAGTDPPPGTAHRLPATVKLFVSTGPPQVDTGIETTPTPGGD